MEAHTELDVWSLKSRNEAPFPAKSEDFDAFNASILGGAPLLITVKYLYLLQPCT